MDEDKIKTVKDLKAPSNKNELQSFLGFINFYRRFIDKYQKNKPLNFTVTGNIMAHKPTKLLGRISVDLMGPLPTRRGGVPESILTDNGTQFANKRWRNKMNELDIAVSFSTKYHPQSNPVKRYNREIGRILRTYCSNQHTKWSNMLGMVEAWMNKMKSEITEETPFEVICSEKR